MTTHDPIEQTPEQIASNIWHNWVKDGCFGNPIEAIKSAISTERARREEAEARLKKADGIEKAIDDLLSIQVNDPFTKEDSYMAGLANGLLLAKSLFGGKYNPISFSDKKFHELKASLASKDAEIATLQTVIVEKDKALNFYALDENYHKRDVLAEVAGGDVPEDCPDKDAHIQANVIGEDHCFHKGNLIRHTTHDIRPWGDSPVFKDLGENARKALALSPEGMKSEIDRLNLYIKELQEAQMESGFKTLARIEKLEGVLKKILEQPNETLSNAKALRWAMKIAREALKEGGE